MGAGLDGGLLVFTDLDGCLLDERTYSWEEARPALDALRARRIPLLLCSSKTRSEMETLAGGLGLAWPYVVENGGALVLHGARSSVADPAPEPRQTDPRVVVLGKPMATLRKALREIASETGSRLRAFEDLSADEIGRLTGLSGPAIDLARRREFDAPFLVEEGAASAVAGAAEARGLQVTRGGRFFHLTGPTDKGRAVLELLRLYPGNGSGRVAVALGDSPNDLSMLQAVDRPIVVPRPGGACDETLAAALAGAERAPAPGPRGWNEAVLAVLRGERLPALERSAP
jgi:mannosyl-3-phosphoglycerate phosphatase